nr:ABC transporter ATP-binding protein [Salinicola tamaricis]
MEQGEFIAFLGPSGCGKTTVLRMIAGFETPSAGVIRIGDEEVTRLPANRRHIGMVFQSYALFPNMSVYDNVAFGLKIAGMAKREIDARVREMLALIDLEPLAGRYAYQMSGGQQQRVALARALAPRPGCCCWTSRCRRWMPVSAWRCATTFAASSASWASPRSSSPTTRRRRCRSPIAWW